MHSVETQSSRLQDEYLHMAAPNRVFIITGLFVILAVPRLTTTNKLYKSLVFLGPNEGSVRLKYHAYYTDRSARGISAIFRFRFRILEKTIVRYRIIAL